MVHPKCTICGLPALVYETTVEGDVVSTHPYCEKHGAPLLPQIEIEPEAIQQAQQRFEILTEAEKQQLALLRRLTRGA